MTTHIVRSLEETYSVAQALAKTLQPGDVVLLHGNLGAGKTAFVRGLAEALGVTRPIKSPTFTLLWEYQLPHHATSLYHFDLYRLPEGSATDSIGLDEVLSEGRGIVCIEWAEKLLAPPRGISIQIERIDDTARTITITR